MDTSLNSEVLYHYERGRNIFYFAEVFLGVHLNPAQRRWFRLLNQNSDGWSWKYRRVLHVAANQIGKTLGLAIAILWACMYKIGVKPGNVDQWNSTPYNWYHLAPTYTQSLLVMKDMRLLMQGQHPAQFDRETNLRRKVWFQEAMFTETKFDSIYPGFILFNGSAIHFRSSDEKAKSLQGVRAHGISMDECAFEMHLKEVLNEAVKLRMISTGGPFWGVSTPNGINDFYEVSMDVINHSATTFHERVWESQTRKAALVWSHIDDNVGYGLTREDVDFMEADLAASASDTKEQQLRGAFLEPRDAFFSPMSQIAGAWTTKLPESQEPQNGHSYVIFWDPSSSSDPTVVVVIDVTKKPWRGVYYHKWEVPMPFRELIEEMYATHAHFNKGVSGLPGGRPRAITGFDATSLGGRFIRDELTGMTPQYPVNFAGTSKIKLNALTTLRAALSKRDLYLPAAWVETKREVFNYRYPNDKDIPQDFVMALAGAVKIASEGYFVGASRAPFDVSHRTYIGK